MNATRFLTLLLAMLMVFSAMSFMGCQDTPEPPVPDEPDTPDPPDIPDTPVQPNQPSELTLVNEGVSEYVIVHGENAFPSEVTAAAELQKYLKQISGAELAIVTDSTPAAEKEIVVGKTNRENEGEFDREVLGTDGFIIKTRDSKLYLVGGEQRGTLYAVYEFLESYLDCRFFTRTVEHVPAQATITVAAINMDRQLPYFDYRNVFWYEILNDQFAVKQKVNANNGAKRPDTYGGVIGYTGTASHTFSEFCSPDVYYKDHPEYFAWTGANRNAGSICLTNPDVLQLAIDYTRGLLEKEPNAYMISISQNDNIVFCVCDNCMAVYEEEGGHYSGAVLRFVNAIARDIAEDYPNVFIDTFAYQYTATAPTKTVAEDNVIVRLCHVTGCSSHIVEDRCWGGTIYKIPSNLDGTILPLADCLEAWGEICKNVYIWDYNACFHQYGQIYPNFNSLLSNAWYYQDNNVRGIFAQGAYQGKSGEFAELRAYLTAKILWDPRMSEKEFFVHMDEFLLGVYGPGGSKLREFLDLAEELTEDTCFHWGLDMKMFIESEKQTVDTGAKGLPSELTLDMIENYESTDWSPYYQYYEAVTVSCELLERGRALFAEAMEMAQTEEQRMAIEQATVQLDLLESYYRDAVNAAIVENIRFLCEAYLKEHSDLTSTKQIQSLAAKVSNHVLNQELLPAYEQFNRAICEKADNLKVWYSGENSYAKVKRYQENPDNWF